MNPTQKLAAESEIIQIHALQGSPVGIKHTFEELERGGKFVLNGAKDFIDAHCHSTKKLLTIFPQELLPQEKLYVTGASL